MEIDLLDSLPRSKRPLGQRAEVSELDKKLSWKLDQEYFDGTRAQGLGGYYYDGRWKSVARRLAEHYDIGRESSVLDIGCAKGFLLHDFMEEYPGITVAGLDISSYAIREATEKAKPHLVLGNAKQLPFADDSFDLVVSICSLHNILDRNDTIKSLQEIERVSRGKSYVKLGAYRNDEEKEILDRWAVVATTYLHVNDWLELFDKAGYTGDYTWFHPAISN